MKKIKNYEVIERVAETRGSLVYRARKDGEKSTVIIKVLKAKYPSLSDIARFKQEYEIIRSFEFDGVIKTFEILQDSDDFALVLEDFEGISIKEFLCRRQFDIPLFLEVGITLCETLGHIHAKEIFHKDINPRNILINQTTETVKITGFGISTILTHENDEIYHPDVIEGTIAYISPEQTGRMNRSVDYRTDYYSLGVTFYEMLTGSVPFMSKDPMEIIHSHIAVNPIPPAERNPDIPKVVSDIIVRLLLKTPEERYQNAYGLMADLKECLRQIKEKGTIQSFRLGQKDISNRFIIPQVMIGREKETAILLKTFDNVCGGEPKLMLVAGKPGIGKSTLVNEIYKPITAKRGYFISGKYERIRRDVPYSAIIEAFQRLIRNILSESEERITIWKNNLLAALGPNGKVIADIIPEVALIIGKSPNIPLLEPVQARNRFNVVFKNFVSVFTQKDHPVALFLDDLQWADLASLQMIRYLITSLDINYLFVIGSYRDNEVTEAHPLMDTLDEIEKAHIQIDKVYLLSLQEKDVIRLITDFLKCPQEHGDALGKLVYRKTSGNPFFVNQFMKILYDKKVLKLDGASGWQWDFDRINQMQVTDNVVNLLAENIITLPSDSLEVLKFCACIGTHFDLETISTGMLKPIDSILKDLTILINDGYIGESAGIYKYQHDRIQEAAYSLISDEEKIALHYIIGRLELARTQENDLKHTLFYIVDHLNLGISLVTGKEDREELVRLNLKAAKKAKVSAAFSPALKYLENGIALLEKNCWEKQYDLSLDIYTEAVETAYINGDLEKMDRFAEIVIEKAHTLVDKAKVFNIKINASYLQQDFSSSIELGFRTLKLFGIDLTEKPYQTAVLEELGIAMTALSGKTDEDLLNMADMSDPKILSIVQILTNLSTAAFQADPELSPLLFLKALNFFIENGNHPLAAIAYCGYGVILVAGLGDIKGAYRFGKLAFKIIDKYNARELKPSAIFRFNILIRHWNEHVKESIASAREGYQIGVETGNLEFAAWNLALSDIYSTNIYNETGLEALAERMGKNHQILKQFKNMPATTMHAIYWQLALNLSGNCDDPVMLVGKAFDERTVEPVLLRTKNYSGLATLYNAKLFLLILMRKYPEAYEYYKKLEKYKDSVRGSNVTIFINYLESTLMLTLYPNVSKDEQASFLKKVEENQTVLKHWADQTPMNFLYRYHMVEAERARVMGDVVLAMHSYEKAIALAKKYNFPDEAAYLRLAASFYLSIGLEKVAKVYMTDAYSTYAKMGATAVMKSLEEDYPNLITSSVKDSYGLASEQTKTGTVFELIDISTVTKASQTISGEIVLSKLLVKMIQIAMENAGAQKGVIILKDKDKLLVEAEAVLGKKEVAVLQSIPIENHQGLSMSIVHYVARTNETLILSDATNEGSFTQDPYVLKNQPKSILCMAILNQGRVTGILYLENNLSTGVFTPARLAILNILSSQIAISINNARLYANLEQKVGERTIELKQAYDKIKQFAHTDQLTSLSNRRDMLEKIENERKRIKRYGKQFSLILCDIDNFKSINDTYGHDCGDYILVEIARVMKSMIREQDTVARWGGEEFLFLLPLTPLSGAKAIAEKIRKNIFSTPFQYKNHSISISMTFGVSLFEKYSTDINECLYQADNALYKGKAKGKNCIVLAGSREAG
ncbi:MAG: diguanylate cyclase [Proteobacteria bacterium]|nr:diguanylate cyclase [Pseudomonadota bacterium]